MIDPNELRVVGTIDENKGLSEIKVGNVASFTVDAFGNKKFTGVVEEVSPTSKESGVTFSISDKREIKQFTVKIKYDTLAFPDFKNGMSAKIKIYTK
jgi:multidrug resistance efflux pump